jgi:hypothetical protein
VALSPVRSAMEEPERRKGERKKRVFGDNTLKVAIQLPFSLLSL